ncbi:hypothetical protein [Klebsiella variicola]|uniref:hypothetical protein n=1 Tax=Klebsiella variicola TaxID=244366 RepID=UPI003DA07918
MTTDITELAQSEINDALAQLKQISEYPTPSTQYARVLRKYIATIVEALEKAQRANAAQDDHINQQQDRIDQLEKGHQEAAKQINSWRRMAKQNIAEREKDIAELDAARQRIAELESRTVTPVNYSENTDADHCRKWAWQQVKGEVSTEGWTSGDNANYFGFFCWGWDMRRQYNEQRPINVKLPKTMYTEFDDDDYCREVAVLDKQQVIDCLRDAGIKVEAE